MPSGASAGVVAEEIGEDETPTDRVQRHLDAFLTEHAPDAVVTHRWAGTMGFSADGLPYAGEVEPPRPAMVTNMS